LDPGLSPFGRGRHHVDDEEDNGEEEESGIALDSDDVSYLTYVQSSRPDIDSTPNKIKTSRTTAAIHEEYELKLLDERAKLLQELADLNIRSNHRREA
jgi:hypothetical protein